MQKGKLIYRAYDQNGKHGTDASEGGLTPTKLPFTPISFTGYFGGAGDPTFWMNDYYVPSTDGKLREVSVEHWVGKTTMKVITNRIVATNFRPSIISIDGDAQNVVMTNSAGTVFIRKITGSYGKQLLGASVLLPARLIKPTTLAARHVGTSLRIYSTSKATAHLTEIIVPDGHPERARAYTIATSGYSTLTALVPGFCSGTYAHDVPLIGINQASGNAVLFRHRNSIAHGATVTPKIPVGTPGGWKSWSGIGD